MYILSRICQNMVCFASVWRNVILHLSGDENGVKYGLFCKRLEECHLHLSGDKNWRKIWSALQASGGMSFALVG